MNSARLDRSNSKLEFKARQQVSRSFECFLPHATLLPIMYFSENEEIYKTKRHIILCSFEKFAHCSSLVQTLSLLVITNNTGCTEKLYVTGGYNLN